MSIDYLVYSIGAVFSYINVALIYSKITDSKLNSKIYKYVLLVGLAILNSIVIIHLPIAVKPVYNLVCFCLSIVIFFKEKIKTSLYYSIIIWIAGSILDIVFMALFKVGFEFILNKWPHWGILIISLMLQLFLNIEFRIKPLNKLIVKIRDKLAGVHNLIWIFLLIVFLVVFFTVTAFANVRATKNVLMLLLLLAICILLAVFLIKILYDEKTFKITIENLLADNRYYLEVNTKDRVFKHNIIHKLNGIKSISNDKTVKLIDDLIDEYNIEKTSNKNIDVLPNGINGIISRIIYSYDTSNMNILINNYLNNDLFDVLTPRKYNKLCETIGLCLDNAMSAAISSKEKILQIVILEDDESIIVKIANTFKSSMDVDKLGTLSYSTKKEGHGLGLYSLFTKKDLFIKTSIINSLFENQIIIKKQIKTSI